MAVVGSDAPAHQNPGVDFAGNDIYKALSMWAYYEATKDRIVFVQAGLRERQITN